MDNQSFCPDWVSPPGETIRDLLSDKGLDLNNFAQLIGAPLEFAADLLRGRQEINEAVAASLESVFSISSEFWIRRQTKYRNEIERFAKEAQGEEADRWMSTLPISDMIGFGWIKPGKSLLAQCLQFFNVGTLASWNDRYGSVMRETAFRKSTTFKSTPGAVSSWLRQGEIESETLSLGHWDKERLRAELPSLLALTRIKAPCEFIPKLQQICSACGVAVSIVRAPTGCRTSGATFYTPDGKPILLLSFRYLSDDHFWFSFFHEVGHLLLHGNRLFLEGEEYATSSEEDEANGFAEAVLIPPEYDYELERISSSPYDIVRFSNKLGIAPGIVVGQMQHKRIIRRNQFNKLKRRYTWAG